MNKLFRHRRIRALVFCMMAFSVLSPPVEAEEPVSLSSIIREHWGGEWREVSEAEYAAAQSLFGVILKDINDPDILPRLSALELGARTVNTSVGVVKVIFELPSARRGRGVFVFQQNESQVLLQTPHARADLSTGRITAEWMENLPFRAAAWNSIGRNAERGKAADLARVRRSYFTALTDVAIKLLPAPVVVQLHGFATEKRTSEAGRASQVILSSGTKRPNPPTLARAACLDSLLDAVKIYPLDVLELSGSSNPVGRLLDQEGIAGFVHVEMVGALRSQLREDKSLSIEVGRCLFAG